MLLLEKDSRLSSTNAKKIVLISQRESVLKKVAPLLRSGGVEYVDEVNSDFFSDTSLSFPPDEVLGIILDIGDFSSSDIESITNAIYGLIPQNIWCCLIGDNDSISIAQKFLKQGIYYFHLDSQSEQMVQQVVSGISVPEVRNAVVIDVLSCKGGIGGTTISSHMASIIAESKRVSVLLSQHASGSSDLDLLFGRRIMAGNMEEYNENLRLFMGDVTKIKEENLRRFHFIVNDLPIFNKTKDEFVDILKRGSNFVLVIERRISSIRTAKQFLDEYKNVQQTNPKARRIFICINDHRADLAKQMAVPDIERLLESMVDTVIPFARKTTDKVMDIDFGKNGTSELESLAMRLLGMVSRKQDKPSKSALVSFGRYLMNK